MTIPAAPVPPPSPDPATDGLTDAELDEISRSAIYSAPTDRKNIRRLLEEVRRLRAASSPAPAAGDGGSAKELHARIMNLRRGKGWDEWDCGSYHAGYNRGHRDARHAAAELVSRAGDGGDAARAENEALWATFVRLGELLDMDTEACRKMPGKPSDVFAAHVKALRDDRDSLRAVIRKATENIDSPDEVKALSARIGLAMGVDHRIKEQASPTAVPGPPRPATGDAAEGKVTA